MNLSEKTLARQKNGTQMPCGCWVLFASGLTSTRDMTAFCEAIIDELCDLHDYVQRAFKEHRCELVSETNPNGMPQP